jgi:hypothetical protein
MAHETMGRGTRRRTVALFSLGLLAAACTKTTAPEPAPENGAQLELAISQAPPAVACVTITIASDHTDRRSFDVPALQPTTFSLSQVAVGTVVISVDAFAVACAAVTPGTASILTGGPVSVTLKPGRNGTVVIVPTPASQATLAIGFDPNAPPTCAPGGSACTQNADCCSQRCTSDAPGAQGASLCRADEPPAPTGALLNYQRDLLEPLHARASYPAFDGDLTFVAFPRTAITRPEDRTVEGVREHFVDPALRATGFDLVDRVATPPQRAQIVPGGSFANLVETVCEGERNTDGGRLLCDYLSKLDPNTPAPGRITPAAFVAATLGMAPERLREEIDQPLNYWFFAQRDRGGVPVEHKGVLAIQHGNERAVSSVFGSVLANTRIVNQVGLVAQAALQRGFAALVKLEGLPPGPKPKGPAQLVLLPYGAPADDKTVTALRFAYRTRVDAARPVPGSNRTELAAYLAWIDASNGDLLKYVPESGNAALNRSVIPWCRDPSEAVSAQCSVSVPLTDGATPGTYTLSNANLVLTYPGVKSLPPGMLSELFPTPPQANEACNSAANFRGASAFAQLEKARKTVQNGGKFIGFGTSQLRAVLDEAGLQDSANFSQLSLSFIQGALSPAAPPGAIADCTHGADQLLNGAEDTTILAHEYAHLVTMQQQNGNPSNNCGASDCPILNPYNRRFFHDYSDGVAAMLAESPCIGGWTAKNVTEGHTGVGMVGGSAREDVARACGDSQEGFALPRLVYADARPESAFAATGAFMMGASAATAPAVRTDAFPVHRVGLNASPGEYGDGQIIGAALWHLWQGVKSQAKLQGGMPVWGRLNEAVWSTGFSSTVCPVSDTSCDVNIYRAGRELLLHLTDAWLANYGSQSLNKLLGGFARAGLFLAPPACLQGAFKDVTPPLDPQFCPTMKDGADAIVDIDDGDPSDFSERFGIRMADDDFVKDGATPTFRIWTGAPYAFDPVAGTTLAPVALLCNDTFLVQVRHAGDTAWTDDASGTTKPSSNPMSPCYAEAPMINTALFKLADKDNGFATVEYRVLTNRGDIKTGPTPRDSIMPGNGLWSATSPTPVSEIKPSAFFITPTGAPPL